MPDVTVTPEPDEVSEVTVLPEAAEVTVATGVAAASIAVPVVARAEAIVRGEADAYAVVPSAVTAVAVVDEPLGHVTVGLGVGVPGPPGPGVPPDGLDGYVLTKVSDADYDTAWLPPGAGSGEVWAFRHVQDVAATVWTVTHPLDFRPTVTVVANVRGMGLEQVVAEVVWTAPSTARITFTTALSGEVYFT